MFAILIFFSKTFKKVSSRVNKSSQQNVNKIQKTVKLKELDEFGTFFKKVIHSVFFYYVLVKNSDFFKRSFDL